MLCRHACGRQPTRRRNQPFAVDCLASRVRKALVYRNDTPLADCDACVADFTCMHVKQADVGQLEINHMCQP